MIIYLIGPSGVGKTTLAKKAREFFGINYFSIDELCRGNESKWSVCRNVFLGIEKEQKGLGNCIVDIGAGTQTIEDLRGFLLSKALNVILLYAPPEEVIKRNPCGSNRNLDEYSNTEYGSREKLYSIVGHKIDLSGKIKNEAEKYFIEYLKNNFKLS